MENLDLINFQNIRDSVLELGVLILVSTDLVILILNIVISKALGQFEVTLVPNKDQTRTVSGVIMHAHKINNVIMNSLCFDIGKSCVQRSCDLRL